MIEPLVSVHMITYNHAPYIAKAIDGVLQQEVNFPIELVIGEDCSTDGTREIVFDFQKKYPDFIRVITSGKNIGAKKNGYRTMKACRGKHVAFCEGDDYWHHPLKVQKQTDYLEAHPECGLVYSNFDVERVKTKKRIQDYNTFVYGSSLGCSPELAEIVEGTSGIVHTCTVIARKALVDKIIDSDEYLYRDESVLMGDLQLWAEIAAHAKVFYINESLGTRCLLENSVTESKDGTNGLRFYISLNEVKLYLCKKYNLPEQMRMRFESERRRDMLRLAFVERNCGKAKQVKNMGKNLSPKEWVLYIGATTPMVHSPLSRLYRIYKWFHTTI